jgi:hypothetical protein
MPDADLPVEEQSPTGATKASSEGANSDTVEPEENDASKLLGLRVCPDFDPYSNGGPQWAFSALQAIGVLADAASAPADIRGCERIIGQVVQLVDALGPTFLNIPIPRKKRARLVGLLRDRCGYTAFVEQLQACWANADSTTAHAQSDIFSGH